MPGQYIIDAFLEGKLAPFYDNVYPGLLFYAKKLLGPERDMYAEDCVQNIVYKVWMRRDSLSSALSSLTTFRIYFYLAIRNETLNIKRKDSSHKKYLSQLESPEGFMNSIIENETLAAIFEAVKGLDPRERQIIEMSYVRGMKNLEIVQELGISLASIKRLKARALDAIRRNFGFLIE